MNEICVFSFANISFSWSYFCFCLFFQDLFENIIYMRQLSDETPDTSDTYGELIVNLVITVSHLLLFDSIPGESYLLQSANGLLLVESSKISNIYFDVCGRLTNSVQLNEEYIQLKYQQENNNNIDYFDCSIMITPSNLYQLHTTLNNYNNSMYQSAFLMLDVSSFSSVTNSASASDTQRQLVTSMTSSQMLTDCNPIILTFNHTNVSFFQTNIDGDEYY